MNQINKVLRYLQLLAYEYLRHALQVECSWEHDLFIFNFRKALIFWDTYSRIYRVFYQHFVSISATTIFLERI